MTGCVDVAIEDAVGWITLDRPAHLNAVTVELGVELERALLATGSRHDVNVVVLRGAGGNLSPAATSTRSSSCGAAARMRCARCSSGSGPPAAPSPTSTCRSWPPSKGCGGLELMLAADVVLVHDDARIADNHICFGQVPGGGSTQRLPRVLGRQRALSLLLAGERLTGAERGATRPRPRVVPPRGVRRRGGAAFLAALAGRSRDAVVAIKRLVAAGSSVDLHGGLELELQAAVAPFIAGEAGRAGVAAFTEERP